MTARAGARVKICGLTESDGLRASVDAGAAYLGFNFFKRSPRYVSPARAAELCGEVPAGICRVALVVDPSDAALDEILSMTGFDMVQLHGQESPKRVREIKALTGLPVMKALGTSGPDDLPSIDAYADVADQLLIDTKPPKNAALPGGNGVTFDWNLIAGRRWPVPWMLAGGLTAENVREAMRQTGALQVDLSSSVESAPGVKDPARIRAFLAAVSESVPVI